MREYVDEEMGMRNWRKHQQKLMNADCNLVISYIENGEKKKYEAYSMSDGERIILYLVGRIMQAPENGLVIVDEPEIFLHRTVVDKLWNRLEGLSFNGFGFLEDRPR